MAESADFSLATSVDITLAGAIGHFYLVCYVRHNDRVFETYWTTGRGVEVMGNSYSLLNLTAYGRQETWEDSPPGWPQPWGGVNQPDPYRINGRPIGQWSRLDAGHSDDLGGLRTPSESTPRG